MCISTLSWNFPTLNFSLVDVHGEGGSYRPSNMGHFRKKMAKIFYGEVSTQSGSPKIFFASPLQCSYFFILMAKVFNWCHKFVTDGVISCCFFFMEKFVIYYRAAAASDFFFARWGGKKNCNFPNGKFFGTLLPKNNRRIIDTTPISENSHARVLRPFIAPLLL